MASLARNLFERRVPHVLVIYAGGSFALVEFTAFMIDEFLLSPHWTRVVLTAVLLLLPSVAMLAWFHGRQGRDEVPLAEKIGIPANLAVAATVLLLLFGGQDLGAATTAVSVETEDGETVERVVPKAEFRKRTALFPFDAGPGLDEEEAWLTYMAPLVLELDLAADDFFEPLLFAAFMQRLAELGFPALRDVPLHSSARSRRSSTPPSSSVARSKMWRTNIASRSLCTTRRVARRSAKRSTRGPIIWRSSTRCRRLPPTHWRSPTATRSQTSRCGNG